MALRGTTGTPERLQRASGAWKLELERFIHDGPWMLRPRRFEVSGEDAILQQLRDLRGFELLAKDAQRIFAAQSAADGAFVARENRWVAEVRVEPAARAPDIGSTDAEPVAERMDRLNARVQSLEASVRALERTVRELQAASVQNAAAYASGRHQGSDATLESSQTAAGAAAKQPSKRPSPPAEAKAAPAAAPPQPSITLPAHAIVSELVRSLAGADAAFNPRSALDWSAMTDAYYCAIQTRDGAEVGVLVLDVESTLRLAGALLMESDEAIRALVQNKAMSDEIIDAASEVGNTFMSAFNKTSGNPHVRAGKLLALDAAMAARVQGSSKRDDYNYNRGGHVALVAL
jgi:hypothetical protein